jgi:hypothetical protein
MSATRNSDDGEPTIAMPARTVADTALPDVIQWLAASRRKRRRRLALYAGVGFVFIAGMAAGGWFFFPRNEKPRAVSGQPAQEVAGPQVMRPTSVPAPRPALRTPDKPSSRDRC